jgi:hypothetical protein
MGHAHKDSIKTRAFEEDASETFGGAVALVASRVSN